MLPDNENRSRDQHTPVNDEIGQATSEHNQPQQTLGQPEGPASIVLESPIPGYRLKPEIAQGGMGIVYWAECLTFGREVAVKVMKAGMSAAVFNREAQITARLPHPGIPPVHALGTLPDGRPYLVMKLIKGETLDSILKNRSDFSSDRGKLVAVFEHICQAVGFAHAQGIIHRDLKPSNVMVGAFGEVQVMDWGLAREVRGAEEIEPETVVTDQSLTMAGQVKGTPAFMAPEQARGEELDARADVFALGGMLAAILTGRPPFSGNSVMETIARAVKCDLGETLSRLDVSGADPELLALCRRCLEARREDRPADGTKLAVAVAEYRAEVEARLIQAERERAAEAERLKRRRTQWALAGTAGLLMVAGLFGIVVAYLWRAAESNRAEAEIQRDTANNAKADADVQREKVAVFEYGGAMRVAHQEWRDGNLTAMGALLDSADPKLRGWEWRYLNRLRDPSLLSFGEHKYLNRLRDPSLLSLGEHTNHVNSAQFSFDGNRIVTASSGNIVNVWDAKTGKKLISLKGDTNVLNSATFSYDGKRIVTTGENTAKVWDVETGKELAVLKGHLDTVSSAQFRSDGNRIVTASDDQTAKVWDANTGAELLCLKGHTNAVNSAQFSPDGNRILTASGDNIFSTQSGDNTAKVWDANTGKQLISLNGDGNAVNSAQFSPDGNRILTASYDGTAKVWDVNTDADMLSLYGQRNLLFQGAHKCREFRSVQPRRKPHSYRKL
ncbi:MAG: serine/threonine protein kinase [Planctomycetota bacterium]|nr:serine/threonine protein kinase [Planctomycetota bacterium]